MKKLRSAEGQNGEYTMIEESSDNLYNQQIAKNVEKVDICKICLENYALK